MAERAALITGASGGIGLAIAAVLAEEGYGAGVYEAVVTTLAERRG